MHAAVRARFPICNVAQRTAMDRFIRGEVSHRSNIEIPPLRNTRTRADTICTRMDTHTCTHAHQRKDALTVAGFTNPRCVSCIASRAVPFRSLKTSRREFSPRRYFVAPFAGPVWKQWRPRRGSAGLWRGRNFTDVAF